MTSANSNSSGSGGMFSPPTTVAPQGFNPFGLGLQISPEIAAAGLRGLMTHAAPYLSGIVGNIDDQMIEHAIRMSVGETQAQPRKTDNNINQNEQFSETVTVDKSGDQEKHRVDINLGVDAKADSLKISRKDHVMTINVKTEKTSDDGSSHLYQEFTKKVTLPENVDLSQLESALSTQGVLTIMAPFLQKLQQTKFNGAQSTPIPVTID